MSSITKSSLITIFALTAALAYLLVGISHFLMPPEQLHFAHGVTAEFFVSLSHEFLAFHFHYWAFILALLFTGGVFSLIQAEETWPRFYTIARLWAYLGLAVLTFDFARMHFQAIHWAAGFSSLSSPAKEVLLASGLDRLDPYGISFNLIGFFVITLNYLELRSRRLPRWIALLGLAGGLLLQLVLVGTVSHLSLLIDLAAGLGGIVIFPLWLVSFGLWQRKDQALPI
ncbi:hypothetical protein NLC35_00705 [Candidatus Aminicenantes bacterium AC-334-K16]|jgi:hypothetical protein|nr:hypothetical protein [Candidatus Aminicenantes bacterium AC-334-K16]